MQLGEPLDEGQADAHAAQHLVDLWNSGHGDKIALTAWTDWTECTGFNLRAANAFRKAFRYHAPEQFPKSFLEPGQ